MTEKGHDKYNMKYNTHAMHQGHESGGCYLMMQAEDVSYTTSPTLYFSSKPLFTQIPPS